MPENAYRVTKVAIDYIRAEGRHRKDLGRLETLAASMKLGLINPVTITPDGQLLAGGRRIAAARMLGWTHIDAHEVDTLDDARRALLIERDENTERKDMKWSERVSLGKALEGLERPKAEARRTSAPLDKRPGHVTRTLIDADISIGKTNDIVGEALGISGSTYDRAKFVVDTAANPNVTEEERSNAQEALAQMDATGKVGPAYDKVRSKTDRPRVASPRPAPPKPKITAAKQQRQAINVAVTKLSGIAYGLGQIKEIHDHITSDEAAQWVDGLTESRLVITQLINLLKEHTNA